MTENLDIHPAVEAAVAHHRAGRLDQAEAGYRAVLAAAPGHPRAAHNLGTLLLQTDRAADALDWLATAVESDPAGPWWEAYAKALIREGRFDAAEALIGAHPGKPALEVLLRERWAAALIGAKAYDEAEAELLKAQAVAPDNADVAADLGFVRLLQERPLEAQAALERALALAPDHVQALGNLGTVKRRLGRYDEAEALYRRVLELDPDNHGAAVNLRTLPGREAAGAERRIAELTRLLEIAGQDQSPDTLARFGSNLGALGHREHAMELLDRAVALDPERLAAQYYRAFARLGEGDYVGGWDDYEIRLKTPSMQGSGLSDEMRERLLFAPTREEIAGRDLLLVSEQGLGDVVMFASMLPDLLRDARRVTCFCDGRLIRLFRASFPQVEFVDRDPGPGRLAIAMGSLGRLYRRELSDFPRTPFLAPRPEVAAGWAERLGPRGPGLRIGVSWRGGVKTTHTGRRSLDLERLASRLQIPGCELVSLQYGDVRQEVEAANARLAASVRLFPAGDILDFEDLAGLVQSLDVVVSVQTALVHLCGALGKRCLTLVPHVPEWRYGASGPTMPWYGSVELFRQQKPGAWEPVIDEIRQALLR